MGVYIPKMKKPQYCGTCILCLDDSRICHGYCMIFHRKVNMMELDKDCPLIEISEPHGRLGDLDEMKTAFPCGESIRAESVRATIDHMPTIIPAEEG